MVAVRAVLVMLGFVAPAAGQVCVQSVTGTMLCCDASDTVCLGKQREAHPSHPTEEDIFTTISQQPWYSGTLGTFARFPTWNGEDDYDLCIVGVPYDLGGSNARLAPGMVRTASKRIQPYNRLYKQSLASGIVGGRGLRIVDADDIAVSPYDVRIASKDIEQGLERVFVSGQGCVVLGGDHAITYSALKALKARFGNFSLIHLDAHLDAHGTPLKWAVTQGLFEVRHSIHVGIRGGASSVREDAHNAELGFQAIDTTEALSLGPQKVAEKILQRLRRRDGTYTNAVIVLDLDVIDPAFAPAVEIPEIGGLSTADVQAILAGLGGAVPVVSAVLVGAAPEQDTTKVTGLVAAGLANDVLHLIAKGSTAITFPPLPEV